MKPLVYSLAVLLVVVCTTCEAGGGGGGMKKFFEECKTEAGITDEIKKGQKPNFEDPKVKCFFTCLKKKQGIIVDGKVNADELIKKYSKNKELEDEKKEALKGCAETANQVEECEVGPALMKCLKEKGFGRGGKKKPQEKPKEGGEGGEQ